MVYETFLKTIQSMVQTRLNKKANVSLRRVLKNNGLMLDGLSFTKPGSRLSPTVYLNAYYNEVEEGMPLSIITDQILMVYETNPGFSEDICEELRDFDAVRGRIAYKLIHAAKNKVLLSNGTFAASAEGVTASFGLPAKGEMDPTGIMAACYVFLFGLMLSDAAYGFIVFLMCFLALKKFPRMEENLRKSLRLFMYCGLSTLFWGVMFGGYFGDAVDIVSRTYFGHTVTIPALWFVPLNDPMKLLVYSMLFGVIHLFLGLGLKGYMLLKDGKVVDFICDVVLWYLLLLGLILMLLPTELFGSIAQMNIVFPPVLNSLAKGMAIVGALGILVMSARDKKNPILRLALGAYDLYNITGWVSDVLSYSRLLALGLATGVIASVINQMGSMVGNNVFGVIVFILVFCFGHLFNLAINLLGAYVHTCRLQYVEFFGKFYEGGGKAFRPFKQITKYVEIKED